MLEVHHVHVNKEKEFHYKVLHSTKIKLKKIHNSKLNPMEK